MKEYKVNVPVDYITGHLRYGHLECEVEAESKEEALEKAKNYEDFDLVVDDYEVDSYGNKMWEEAWAEEEEVK